MISGVSHAGRGRSEGVTAEEQVTERAAQQVGDPTSRQMMWPIVDQMTPLAKAAEISRAIIARVVIEVGRCEHDAGVPHLRCFHEVRPSRRSAAIVAPGVLRGIEPTAVRQAAHGLPMRSTAALADAACPLKSEPAG